MCLICIFSRYFVICLVLWQWCYGFYLTHQQGQSGFEFLFKTEDLKKKWLDQFEMAMWVWNPQITILSSPSYHPKPEWLSLLSGTQKETFCFALFCAISIKNQRNTKKYWVTQPYEFKGHLKCFETCSGILCVDFILTETYQAAPPLFKIANSIRLYHSLG